MKNWHCACAHVFQFNWESGSSFSTFSPFKQKMLPADRCRTVFCSLFLDIFLKQFLYGLSIILGLWKSLALWRKNTFCALFYGKMKLFVLLFITILLLLFFDFALFIIIITGEAIRFDDDTSDMVIRFLFFFFGSLCIWFTWHFSKATPDKSTIKSFWFVLMQSKRFAGFDANGCCKWKTF